MIKTLAASLKRDKEKFRVPHSVVRLDLIPGNPVDKVERPKPEKYMAGYYTAEEME